MNGPDELEKLISQHRLQDFLMEKDVNLPTWLEEEPYDDDRIPTPRVPGFSQRPQVPEPPRRRHQTSRKARRPSDAGTATEIRPPLPEEEGVLAAFQVVVCRDGERLGRHVFTQPLIRFGRSPDCELRLDDPGVSRFHASIEAVGLGVYQLRDLNSSNGVRVNGKSIQGWQLSEGDRVGIGDFELVFSSEVKDTRRAKRHSTSRRARRKLEPDDAEAAQAQTVFGQTLNIKPARAHPELREMSIPFRAYLRLEGDKKRVLVKVHQYVLQRDVFVVGSGPEADLQLRGLLIPRVCAVLVRGFGGFSLQAIAGWPFVTRVNHGPIEGQRILEDGDRIVIGGQEFSFHLAMG